MKTLYIECQMGAAGDMLTAALLELVENKEEAVAELNALGIPGVTYEAEKAVRCGITGTHMSVKVDGVDEGDLMEAHEHHHHDHEHEHDHEHSHDQDHEHHHDHEHSHGHEHEHDHHHHHHAGMADIQAIVDAMHVSEKVKADVMAVYGLIGEAESAAHGVPVTEIHFHEVGTKDAVADITAVCLLMEKLAPEKVIVSPINVGGGHVHCAHGILPVPAPATAYILKNVPIYEGHIKRELCTPTGAALLKHFATEFGAMPVMQIEKTGYGCGRKDFEQANVVRAMIGETADAAAEEVPELSCNIDDMTGEELGFAMERLFEAGALDVFTVSIGMKKSRPGVMLKVLCKKEDRDTIIRTIFKYTTTIGIRESMTRRYTLTRSVEALPIPGGEVRRKISTGYGVTRSKWEYEDLAKIALATGKSIEEVKQQLL